jgi:hypothetical protein
MAGLNALTTLGAAPNAGALTSIIAWAIGLICLLLVTSFVIVWVRKRTSPTQEYQEQGFTLADLRELRKKGAMTEEEFERTKARIVQGMQVAIETQGRRTEKTAPGAAKPPTHPGLM